MLVRNSFVTKVRMFLAKRSLNPLLGVGQNFFIWVEPCDQSPIAMTNGLGLSLSMKVSLIFLTMAAFVERVLQNVRNLLARWNV